MGSASGGHGYVMQVPTIPDSTATVCAVALNLEGTPGDNTILGCQTVAIPVQPVPPVPGGAICSARLAGLERATFQQANEWTWNQNVDSFFKTWVIPD